ncbi:hypothetical protein RSAG8_00160, partial [Rhizoctonia solani AG-8 WAC10335]
MLVISNNSFVINASNRSGAVILVGQRRVLRFKRLLVPRCTHLSTRRALGSSPSPFSRTRSLNLTLSIQSSALIRWGSFLRPHPALESSKERTKNPRLPPTHPIFQKPKPSLSPCRTSPPSESIRYAQRHGHEHEVGCPRRNYSLTFDLAVCTKPYWMTTSIQLCHNLACIHSYKLER